MAETEKSNFAGRAIGSVRKLAAERRAVAARACGPVVSERTTLAKNAYTPSRSSSVQRAPHAAVTKHETRPSVSANRARALGRRAERSSRPATPRTVMCPPGSTRPHCSGRGRNATR